MGRGTEGLRAELKELDERRERVVRALAIMEPTEEPTPAHAMEPLPVPAAKPQRQRRAPSTNGGRRSRGSRAGAKQKASETTLTTLRDVLGGMPVGSTMVQKEMREQLGIDSSESTRGFAAMEEEGLVEKTGQRPGASIEWRRTALEIGARTPETATA